MRPTAVALALLAVAPALAQSLPAGDAVIRAKAGPSDIALTTTRRVAGAVHSLTWFGKEFIDSSDHGRQLQSASAFDAGGRPFWAEAFNPTEAGSRRDGAGPRSTSQLLYLKATPTELMTVSRPAFWLNPGDKSDKFPARNTQAVSDHLLSKHIVLGARGLPHAISYKVQYTVPPGEAHTVAQFEALTGYMPAEFGRFETFDPKSGRLAPLSDGPGEQALPVVFSTADGVHAMGVWSPDQPSRGHETAGYGRFRFASEKVVKWNCVFRARGTPRITAGTYAFQMYCAVGSRQNVQDTLAALVALGR